MQIRSHTQTLARSTPRTSSTDDWGDASWRALLKRSSVHSISVWQRSLSDSTAKKEHTMRGFCRDGTAVALVLLGALALSAAADEELIFTNHFLVQLHEGTDGDAHQLALEHGFGSARKASSSMHRQFDACMFASATKAVYFITMH